MKKIKLWKRMEALPVEMTEITPVFEISVIRIILIALSTGIVVGTACKLLIYIL